MHQDVAQLINSLFNLSSANSFKFQLEMIELRISYTKDEYQSGKKTLENKELLQQMVDLYVHVYNKKPIRDFGNVKTLNILDRSG